MSRFTALFERLAIDVLLETSISGATKILGVSWDEAHHLMERAVARGLARRPHAAPRHIGIDEKAIAKGHRYVTVVFDLDQGHVLEVAEDRTFGYRSFEDFRTVILFRCGGLNLYPAIHMDPE